MNHSNSKSADHASVPTSSTTHSSSLSSVSSTYTTLSGFSSSSSYYRGGSAGSLSLASSLTSIEDLQAIPTYEDWNYVAPHAFDYDCHEKPRRRRPMYERLGAIWKDLRAYATDFLHGVSLYNLVVGLVFCYYAWVLLLALSGLGSQLTTVDDPRCKVLLAAHPVVNASSGQGFHTLPHSHVGP
ncbi:hypothetical protein PsYK624_145280 [Phanerochaete sordida]|uniref:Uncharacterized protein n=1 Tax=Phanerochaete sordida TaxID=48140 RepID=A0A9P3GNL7_9APHY|nr:hypothetical protein PsYK624_145280 [Phanerochaete sordida]